MAVVEPVVGALGQGHYSFPGLLGQPVAWRAASVAMGQGRNSLLPVSGQEPANLPQRQAHQLRRLTSSQLPSLYLVQNHRPLLFSCRQ